MSPAKSDTGTVKLSLCTATDAMYSFGNESY